MLMTASKYSTKQFINFQQNTSEKNCKLWQSEQNLKREKEIFETNGLLTVLCGIIM